MEAGNSALRNKKTTYAQQQALVQYLSENRNLISGKFSQYFTSQQSKDLWQHISNELNEMNGATKIWTKWRKSWQDLVSRVKTKAGRINKHRKGTGGGQECSESLTDIEEQVFALLKPVAIEGHQDSIESHVPILSDEIVPMSEEDMDQEPIDLDIFEDYIVPEENSIQSKASSSGEREKTSKILKESFKQSNSHNRLDQVSYDLVSLSDSKLQLKRFYFKKKIEIKEIENEYRKEKLKLYQRDVEAKENIAKGLQFISEAIKRK